MGYMTLRGALKHKGYGMEDLARVLNITYTEAYALTHPEGMIILKEYQKDLIMDTFFSDSKLKKEEVFVNYAYSYHTGRKRPTFDPRGLRKKLILLTM